MTEITQADLLARAEKAEAKLADAERLIRDISQPLDATVGCMVAAARCYFSRHGAERHD